VYTLLQAGPGVQHGRRNILVILHQSLFKGSQRLVNSRLLQEDLGRAGPNHHLAVRLRLELGDVIADLIRQVTLVFSRLGVLSV
jgi:hypothetical protein